MGRAFITSIKGYSKILQENIAGEMSDVHRKALKVIFDCCEVPSESWAILTELIEHNDEDKAMEILNQVDSAGQSYIERDFIRRSIASMEIVQNESSAILQQSNQLTEDQRLFVEIINNNCQREIEVWKEIAEYFS